MTVTKKDILAIKPGHSQAFVVEKPQSIKTAMAMCTYIKNMRQLPEKVERYSCSSDYKNLIVIITAVMKKTEEVAV